MSAACSVPDAGARRAPRAARVAPALLLAACAGSGPAIRVDDAWSRPTAGANPGVVYLSITNDGGSPDRLLAVRSPCCRALEIHLSRVADGRMSMEPVEGGLAVEAGTTVALAPGGYHLMLFEPKEPLRAGASFDVTLEFERSGQIAVTVQVR